MTQNTQIGKRLQALAENDYKVFNEKLIPTNSEIRGIRMPALKKLPEELSTEPEIETYPGNAEFTIRRPVKTIE